MSSIFFISSDYSPLYQRRFSHKSRPPLFCVPRLDDLCDISTVDAILISNYHSFCALPWILETGKCDDWSGAIYCTKPTLEFARIYLTELRKYCDMAENEHKVKTFDTSGSYSQTSLNALPCVSKEQIEACLDRVQERIFVLALELHVSLHPNGRAVVAGAYLDLVAFLVTESRIDLSCT